MKISTKRSWVCQAPTHLSNWVKNQPRGKKSHGGVTKKQQEAPRSFLVGKEAGNHATGLILSCQRDFSRGDVSNQASKLGLKAQEDGEGTHPPSRGL